MISRTLLQLNLTLILLLTSNCFVTFSPLMGAMFREREMAMATNQVRLSYVHRVTITWRLERKLLHCILKDKKNASNCKRTEHENNLLRK